MSKEKIKKEIKLLLIGEVGTGKTSLSLRFISNEFKGDIAPTSCINHFTKNVILDKTELNVELYDTSGNPYALNIAKMLLCNIDGIMFVHSMDIVNSFEYINKFSQELKDKNIPVILINNKKDLETKEEDIKTIKDFAEKNNYNYFECSSKTGEKVVDSVLFLANLIFTKIKEKLVINSVEKKQEKNENLTENENEKNNAKKEKVQPLKNSIKEPTKEVSKEMEEEINAVKKFYKDQSPNLIRCKNCFKIAFIKFNSICNIMEIKCKFCNLTENVTYKDLEKHQCYKSLFCKVCKQKIELKDIKDLVYSYKFQKFICKACINRYFKKGHIKTDEINDITIPYCMMDTMCTTHKKITNYMCMDCKVGCCEDCIVEHRQKSHKVGVLSNSVLQKIITEKTEFLRIEESVYTELDADFNDALNSLKKLYADFKKNKMREIIIRKKLLTLLEKVKYNYELFNTCKSFSFDDLDKPLEYDKNKPWEQKFKVIFDYIKQPMEIIKYSLNKKEIKMSDGNIIEDWKENVIKLKPKIKEEILKAENPEEDKPKKENPHIDEQIKVIFDKSSDEEEENIKKEEEEKIIRGNVLEEIKKINIKVNDICQINNNYFAIGLNDGNLKIYNNKIELITSINLYKNKQGVYSTLKYNNNSLIVSGYEFIYLLKFFESYKEYEKIEEIKEPNTIFTNICLSGDNLIYTTYNNIVLFNLNTKEKKEIYNNIFTDKKEYCILSLKKLMNQNTYYILYNEKDKIIDSSIKRIFDNNFDNEKYTDIEKVFILDNKDNITNEFILPNNFKVIGDVYEDSILLYKKELNKTNAIYLYKYNKKKNFLLYEDIQKYIGFSLIKRAGNNCYFILINEDFSLTYYCYDSHLIKIEALAYIPFSVVLEEKKSLIGPFKAINVGTFILVIFDTGYTIKIDLLCDRILDE